MERSDLFPELEIGRDLCGRLAVSETREWLVTNGIGGYAAGTVAGLHTRRYHGLLVAALEPPLGRTLLVSKLDEVATYAGQTYRLAANRWASGAIDPRGYEHLERFHLEGTVPVWTYAMADALLQKRVWMQRGANTTYVCYTLARAGGPVRLEIAALVDDRDYHGATHAGNWQMRVDAVEHGLRIEPYDGATPFYLLSDGAAMAPRGDWYRDYYLSLEHERGLDEREDHFCAGQLSATLQPGQTVTIVAGAELAPERDGARALAAQADRERRLIADGGQATAPASIRRLILAADQFVVQRPRDDGTDGHTVIAGYPWFGDWGRDTMISLPGLTLTTGRPSVARDVLTTFAGYIDRGMLPNRFPDAGTTPEYNTVDAALWFVEAVRAYHEATGDDDTLAELYSALQDIVAWHRRGTRYDIHIDPSDGLLYAGVEGVQLTWMDAKIGDWVVTPRIGKPVEVNALWYNALRAMADFARRLGHDAAPFEVAAEQAREGFARFWCAERGYCYDVIDGPNGPEAALRPNQLLAVSLEHSPLSLEQQRVVVDVCARRLLTSFGLRSLAPDDPAYHGRYEGDQTSRDAAYHQGTVWAWLIGPFVSAHLRVYRDPAAARSFLDPLLRHLGDYGLGSIGEVFDGDPPFAPRGCVAQAWSVAEVLRAWQAAASVAGRGR